MLVALVMLLLVISGARPFLHRMDEIRHFNTAIVFQDKYEYDSPLDGISLRLIQWRFGLEIISEQNAWISGVGITESQKLLNTKYLEYNLYTGNEELGDTGYIDYNFHNQYVETLLSTGITGLLMLILIIIATFTFYRKSLVFPALSILITVLFFFTESVLERQAGILVFSMMITFAPKNKNSMIP
jgi:O-antigen ligase